jgi:hypothetical protein
MKGNTRRERTILFVNLVEKRQPLRVMRRSRREADFKTSTRTAFSYIVYLSIAAGRLKLEYFLVLDANS